MVRPVIIPMGIYQSENFFGSSVKSHKLFCPIAKAGQFCEHIGIIASATPSGYDCSRILIVIAFAMIQCA